MIYHVRAKNLITLFLVLSLTACSYNPLSDSNHNTGSPVAATVGGAAGLGIAASTGVKYWPVLGAATAGGAGIGYYVSSLRFASSGIVNVGGQVYTQGDYVTIEFPTHRVFDTNSAELLPEAEPVLLSSVDVINRFCCQNIIISGNTSGFSPERYERKLSEARAKVVSTYLWAHGVTGFQKNSTDIRKLTYVGYGNYFPIANDLSNKGIRANSRIQITLYPTRDQLLIDQKKQVFGNMGGFDDSPPTAAAVMASAERAFPSGDVLPESGATHASDIKGALVESSTMNPVISANDARPPDFYKERGNYNLIEGAFPVGESKKSSSQVKVFEGYKGEG